MADMWELSQYVEGHPDDTDQRWRLVKKFYQAKEYRHALEHLQILQNELPDKKNVYRYMAATYYRLGRFEKADEEVRRALKKWPDDIKFLEQQAQILQESGDDEAAANVWEKIALAQTEHRFARKAVKKLRKRVEKDYKKQGGGAPSIAAKMTCPHCGTENEPEFRECWKCHGALSLSDSFAPQAAQVQHQEQGTPVYVPLCKAGILIFLIWGAYFTFREWSWVTAPENAGAAYTTAYEFYQHSMFSTRMAGGLLLLVLWPFVMRVSAYVSGVAELDYDWLMFTGLFFATSGYASTWLPASFQWMSLAGFVVVPFIVILATYRMTMTQRVMTWAFQFAIVTLILITLAGALNGFGIVKDIPRTAALVMASGNQETPQLSLSGVTPITVRSEWESTGSAWLDSKAGAVLMEVELGPTTDRVFLEVTQGESILSYQEIQGGGLALHVGPIEPGAAYQIRVFGEDGISVELSGTGILAYRGEASGS